MISFFQARYRATQKPARMMPGNAPAEVGDQRRLHLWRGTDLMQTLTRWADVVSPTRVRGCSTLDGRLVWLNEGKLVRVNKDGAVV
jgi:hypothetical protein